jgi:predicted DNA-binding transcriptional regulator AlpA
MARRPKPPAASGPDALPIEPLLWGKREAWTALNISDRTLDRLIGSGRFPRPDVRIGRMPRWKPATIRAWIEGGGR